MIPRYKNGEAISEQEAEIIARAFAYRSWQEMEAHAAGASKRRQKVFRQ